MQAYTREKLLDALVEAQQLANLYQHKDGRFIEQTLKWLVALEQDLAKLRHPLAGLAAAQRTNLNGAIDGMGGVGEVSKRKMARFEAIEIVSVIEVELRRVVETIDDQFKLWSDKIAQLAAIASRQTPIKLSSTQLTNVELKKIWTQFGQPPEGANMHQYLSAVMPQADLFYLLNDVINNLLANTSSSPEPIFS